MFHALGIFSKKEPLNIAALASRLTELYNQLPETYFAAPLTLDVHPLVSSHAIRGNSWQSCQQQLIQNWQETSISLSQKAGLHACEVFFILHTLLRPELNHLSFESLNILPEQVSSFWYFIENLLTYNPHLTQLTFPASLRDNIPEKIIQLVEKNHQWQVALYYSSCSQEQMNIQLPCSYSEFQRYRRKLAQTYQATVLPWIKEIFKGLIDEDGKRLKNAIQKEYLPIIEHLARQRELNTKQTASDYSHAFKVWKPEEVETISPQVLAESFAFRG